MADDVPLISYVFQLITIIWYYPHEVQLIYYVFQLLTIIWYYPHNPNDH
jgi:hypothetical protein